MFALVLLSNSSREIDKVFTYEIPEEMEKSIIKGSRIIVPFGRGNRLVDGYVVGIKDKLDVNYSIKKIYQVLDDEIPLTSNQLDMVKFLKTRYLCTYYEALQVVTIPGTRFKKESYYYPSESKITKILKLNEAEVIEYLKRKGLVIKGDLIANIKNVDDKLLKKMVKNKWIKEKFVFKKDAKEIYRLFAKRKFDSEEMKEIYDKISERFKSQKSIVNFFIDNEVGEISELCSCYKVSRGVFERLEELGIIEVFNQVKFRSPYSYQGAIDNEIILNKEQKHIVDDLIIRGGKGYSKSLIKGVTGSGKTYIYLELIRQQLNNGKQCIILVPEIALTSQLVKKVVEIFGDKVALLHSKLSIGERYDQFKGIMEGKLKIIIGARSAIFAPVNKLGLVVIDEEHETSYKSDSNPKYYTHEVAEHLCKLQEASLILGSATPSVENYYLIKNIEGKVYELNKRYNEGSLPKIEIIDMKDELNKGKDSILSDKLIKAMNNRLSKSEQTIIFINRKGYANFVSCRDCGHVIKCPKCDISLVYHEYNNTGTCNYCDYKIQIPEICPICESENLSYFGLGTERVLKDIEEIFPRAKVERMDSVSTSRKNAVDEIVNRMEERKIDILVGTKMVAKGFNFENVTLVGVVAADMMLNFPDYKATESTFQLITQVAGRAGRFSKEGACILQTYDPDDYSLTSSQSYDYDKFYKYEISMRRTFGYPPFKYICNIMFVSEIENECVFSSQNIYNAIKGIIENQEFSDFVEIFQPTAASIEKINNKYRWQVIIKYAKLDQKKIRDIIRYVCIKSRDKLVVGNNLYLSIDLNSINLL